MAACQQQAQGDPTANMLSAANYKYHHHHQYHPQQSDIPTSIPNAYTPSTSSTSSHPIVKPAPAPPTLFAPSPYWPYSPPSFDPRQSNSYN